MVTFKQPAPEYPNRVHIDWVRVDEVNWEQEGVMELFFFFCFGGVSICSLHNACMHATQRGKKTEAPTTCLGRDWPLKSTATNWLGCSRWWLFALHLLLSLCRLALVIAVNLYLAFWRAQMATRITMMARWKPLWWWQVSFALFHSPSLPHTIFSLCSFSNKMNQANYHPHLNFMQNYNLWQIHEQ